MGRRPHRADARREQPFHDIRLVLASAHTEAGRQFLADRRNNPRELAHSTRRIFDCGPCEPDRSRRRVECGSAEDHPGGHNGNGIRSVHDSIHGREMALGLPVGVSLHGRRCIFRQPRKTLAHRL